MYKIKMLDDDGHSKEWTCGGGCVIQGVSPFFQKKSYLLVPDSINDMLKAYSPSECYATRYLPDYKEFTSLESIHHVDISDLANFLTASCVYVASVAVSRFFLMEVPKNFSELTMVNLISLIRSRGLIREYELISGSVDGTRTKVVAVNSTESLMRMLSQLTSGHDADDNISEMLRNTMSVAHACCCQAGTSWNDFETYAGFWHCMLGVWNSTEGGFFDVEHLEDTDELVLSDGMPILPPLFELAVEYSRTGEDLSKIIPGIFSLPISSIIGKNRH